MHRNRSDLHDSNVNNNLLSIQEKLTIKLDRLSRQSLKKLGQRVLSRIVTKIDQPGTGCYLALCLMTKIMPIHAGFEVGNLIHVLFSCEQRFWAPKVMHAHRLSSYAIFRLWSTYWCTWNKFGTEYFYHPT